MIMPKPRQYTRLTANGADAQSKEGRLLIFPAWLKHTVPANDGQSERISISFNLMFDNFTETMASPLWDATAGKEKYSQPDRGPHRPAHVGTTSDVASS